MLWEHADAGSIPAFPTNKYMPESDKKKKILQLRRLGYSYRTIEKKLCVTRSLISYYLGKDTKKNFLSYQRKKRESLRDYINSVRQKSGCMKCGESHVAVLDFHHVRGRKSFSIASYNDNCASRDKIDKEIKKCIVLCSNCHRKLHYEKKQLRPVSQ